MLNWIAIWVGVPVRARRAAPERHAARRPGLERDRRRGEAAGLLGRPVPAGRCTSASSSRSPPSSSTGSRSTGRRSATRSGRSASTPRRRATAASRRRNYFLAMAISGMFAGLAGAIDMLGWEYRIDTNDVQVLADRLHRDRRRAARAEQGGRDRPRGAPLRRARDGHVDAQPRPRDLPARARVEPDAA